MSPTAIRMLVFCGSVLLWPVSAWAQGAIGGVVRDTSGLVLPGVTVEASSPALIERVRTTVTDGNGQYLIVDLRPGAYVVTFSLPGFTVYRRDGLTVSSGATLTVNGELSVGTLEESVTVSGAAGVVDVQSAHQQRVLDSELLESLPRAINISHIAQTLPGMLGSQRDVGGAMGEEFAGGVLSVHGSRGTDQVQTIDGMAVADLTQGRGFVNNTPVGEAAVQEFAFDYSGASAELSTGGVRINVVPREGANTFSGTFVGALTSSGMASSALGDEFQTQWGIARNTQIERIWNVNPAFGGPVLRDRIWFFASYRNWGTNRLPVDAFFEDGTTPARHEENLWGASTRITWQASPRNKVNGYYARHGRSIPYSFVNSLTTPEASTWFYSPSLYVAQAKWTSPVNDRLLLEAGVSHTNQGIDQRKSPASAPDAYRYVEITTGKATRSITTQQMNPVEFTNIVGAASYVTGSHNLKAGFQHSNGYRHQSAEDFPSLQVRTNNGAPFQVVLSAVPFYARPTVRHDLGIYVQDQWRASSRVTVNLGIRFDYNNQGIDAQDSPAGPFVPARSFEAIENVPNWKDLSPRLGVVWDVFGNGRTAVKVSVNRYVEVNLGQFATSVNPLTQGAGASDTRLVVSTNGSSDPLEWTLGPSTNVNFGQPVFAVQPDESLREGWGVRPNNWEYAVSLQQEVRRGLALSVGYFRRTFGNLTWTRNRAIQPSDFTPFEIANPIDGSPITLYNLSPDKLGQIDNWVEFAPENSEVYEGVDVHLNGRFGRQGRITGGMTLGRTVTDTCTAGRLNNPNALLYCRVTPNLLSMGQYQALVAHALPFGLHGSLVFQNLTGLGAGFPAGAANQQWVNALYVVTSAYAGIPLTEGSINNVPLVEPGTLFSDRMNRIDVRLGRTWQTGRMQLQPSLDIFNLFNVTPVSALNNNYGPNWRRPTNILAGRMARIGVQVKF